MNAQRRASLFIVILVISFDCILRARSKNAPIDAFPLDDEADDGYVMEDMNLVQSDQAEPRFLRMPYPYGHMQHHAASSTGGKHDQSKQRPPNLVLTKEITIKQGQLKGYVRVMHSQSGLRNVDQYLGIPYAAPPIGNGRFMAPGMYSSFLLMSCDAKAIPNETNMNENQTHSITWHFICA